MIIRERNTANLISIYKKKQADNKSPMRGNLYWEIITCLTVLERLEKAGIHALSLDTLRMFMEWKRQKLIYEKGPASLIGVLKEFLQITEP